MPIRSYRDLMTLVEQVINGIPSIYRVNSTDVYIINMYKNKLLSITNELTKNYCASDVPTSLRGGDCEKLIGDLWVEFVSDVNKPEHWVRFSVIIAKMMLRGANFLDIETVPVWLSFLALSKLDYDPQLTESLGRLALMTLSFAIGFLMYMLIEKLGTPPEVSAIIANETANDILRAYGASAI